jgi:ethanolamine utilization protein EutN
MQLGRILGKVWATQKDPKLNGLKFYIMQPVDEDNQPLGKPVVAIDTISSREGDLVFWVASGEATFPLDDRQIPSDVSIVGLVDRVDVKMK